MKIKTSIAFAWACALVAFSLLMTASDSMQLMLFAIILAAAALGILMGRLLDYFDSKIERRHRR